MVSEGAVTGRIKEASANAIYHPVNQRCRAPEKAAKLVHLSAMSTAVPHALDRKTQNPMRDHYHFRWYWERIVVHVLYTVSLLVAIKQRRELLHACDM